jgi:hypothetical protein
VQVVDGQMGELTVLVDGQVVARKDQGGMPSLARVVGAVRETASVADAS